ncbi:MFS transporter, DHA2 family, lincomycin resistance protein [Agreia bicolorata]|uniref:MFS transporter, DHA2 family, lincomycin resistance protein n=1 Tax=Agreia bicolorata TaxID=110935 RepID=A0A1T4WRM7_9MICO|nr:DHA2 family efflux MFS transporter permease subunit [Agreia bicolorata]SKA80004.1 MFS transporter, DHA2 family, lincomycin resistance protein [Agreia bicolorata]
MTDHLAPPTDSLPAVAASTHHDAPASPWASDPALAGRNRLVISLLLVSAFVVILNETIMSVALPVLMKDLDIAAEAAQWLTTAFMLTMAVVIPITGFLLQRFNTRPVFLAAMALFSAGTFISAMAPGFEVLLAGRVIQASGTAIMMPLLMTTVLNLVPPATRGRTMGNISIVISVAPAIGPTISGLILSVLDWRWMFWIVLPIAVGSLVLGFLKIPNVTEPRKAPIDVFSVILSAFAFGGLVYGLSSIGGHGTTEGGMPGWLPLVVGVVALAAFILRQVMLARREKALLDLRVFRSSTFSVAIAMLAISMMALFGTLIILPLYTQNVLGLNTLSTGLLLLPGGLLMGVLAPFVGRIYDRFGPRVLLIPGSIIVSAAFWGMTLFTATTAWGWVLAAHVTMSLGLALLFTPLFTAGLASLTPKLYSHGSAVVGTVQQLAGAAGTALFVSVMSAQAIALSGGGTPSAVDTGGGIHAAIMYGAFISLSAIVISFFVKAPAQPSAEGAHDAMPAGH